MQPAASNVACQTAQPLATGVFQKICMVYYLLRRYTEGVGVCDRALSSGQGRSNQLITHPMLAVTYAELGRQEDADRERTITARM
jgi:hypothetical protein